MIAGLVRIAGGRLALAGGDPGADHRRAGPLSRPPGRAEAVADGRGKPRVLGRAISAATEPRRTGAGSGRARRAGRPAGRLPVGRPAAAAVASPGCWRCSGRSGCSTSRPRRSTATRRTRSPADAAAPRRRRADRRGDAWADRARPAQELRLGARRMSPLAALFMRDLRLAIRVGGGGGIGVLFFLIVVALMPFAIGPDLALLAPHRPGDPLARRAAREPADARPAVRGRSRGRLARPDPDGRDAAGARGRRQGAGALAHHRAAAGRSRRRCSACS